MQITLPSKLSILKNFSEIYFTFSSYLFTKYLEFNMKTIQIFIEGLFVMSSHMKSRAYKEIRRKFALGKFPNVKL